MDRIQASFGRFDVSHVQAHQGGAATEACQAMGASAYATGDRVAFAGGASLHTAAHEAAHVIQQQAGISLQGGVGRVGDDHERHADAVADRVVAGRSAEDLLSRYGGGTSAGAGGVQRRTIQMECNEAWLREVRAQFAAWDLDVDTAISMTELSELFQDPSITGDAAAALYTLRDYLEELENLSEDAAEGVTLADIEAYASSHPYDEESDLAGAEGTYYGARHRIAGRQHDLFANASREVDFSAVRQQYIGSCYYLAALVAAVDRDPSVVDDWITENEADGTFTVDLPGHAPITIPPLTDAELALHATTLGDGMWLSILEKAFAHIIAEPDDADVYAQINGGSIAEGIEAVTGHETETNYLPDTWLITTRRRLGAAMRENRIVTASISQEADVQNLPTHHAYTVLAYDEDTDMVTIRNPWGFRELSVDPEQDLVPLASPFDPSRMPMGITLDQQPSQEELMSTRDGEDDGQFTISLERFDELFDFIAYEQLPDPPPTREERPARTSGHYRPPEADDYTPDSNPHGMYAPNGMADGNYL